MNQSKFLPYSLEILLKPKVKKILMWEEFYIVISVILNFRVSYSLRILVTLIHSLVF